MVLSVVLREFLCGVEWFYPLFVVVDWYINCDVEYQISKP